MLRSINGPSGIKTSLKAKVRSRPISSKNNHYLDLYVLNLERSRLLKEITAAENRKNGLEADLRVMESRIKGIEDAVLRAPAAKACRDALKRKNLRKVVMEY
ncbi:MAG: hypothetical protein HZB21_01080 [Deltaproteobacteria bacterium]|nr:hypothetical protein [Deltaproteobacteria bacterium]